MRNGATFIASLVLLAACAKEEAPEPLVSDFRTAYEPPESEREPVESGVSYVDVTDAAGIDFRHEAGAFGRKYLPETMGSGVAMFDYDGDSDLDLLFLQGMEWPGHETLPEQPTMKLYRNDGDWKFTDVTEEAGLAVPCYGMGCAIADYDADGDQDLYVTNLGRNFLFRNDGGKFALLENGPDGGTWTDDKGEEHWSWSTGAAWFDADADGDLDLVVVSYVRWTPESDVYATLTGDEKAYTRPQLYEGDYPRLYLQNEDRTFTDATEESGLRDVPHPGKSLAVCLDDVDGDGDLDLFVANDTVQNFLYFARGDGTFAERARDAGVAYDDRGQARAAMGVDSVDWRNDGKIAIAIGNFSEEPVSLYRVKRAGEDRAVFEDDANAARIGLPTLLSLTFGLLLEDVDHDGWCDLILANGHIEPSVTRIKPEVLYAQSGQLFRNVEGKTFRDVSPAAGEGFAKAIVGRGLAAGDLDGDGDLDLAFTSNGARDEFAKPLLLRCELGNGNRALRVKLRQPGTKNPDALGAVVTAKAGDLTMRRVIRTGGSYLSQGEIAATFGLGAAGRADEVTVRWPDGTVQEVGPLEAGVRTVTR